MSAYVGDIAYHVASDDKDVCLYDQESWPCPAVKIRDQVLAAVLEVVTPKSGCGCEQRDAIRSVREDLAESIKEIYS